MEKAHQDKMTLVKQLLDDLNMDCVKGKLSLQDYLSFIWRLNANLPSGFAIKEVK